MDELTKESLGELNLNFGDVVENGWASDVNPKKRGYFIRYATRQRQKCAEITDGKGKIWHCPLKDHRLTKVADSPLARAHLEARESGGGLVERLRTPLRQEEEYVYGMPIKDVSLDALLECANKERAKAADALAAKDREIKGLRAALRAAKNLIESDAKNMATAFGVTDWRKTAPHAAEIVDAARTALRKDTP